MTRGQRVEVNVASLSASPRYLPATVLEVAPDGRAIVETDDGRCFANVDASSVLAIVWEEAE